MGSAAPRRYDCGDVNFGHVHHHVERAAGFLAADGHRLDKHAGGDLPAEAPFVLAPAAGAFLAAIADDRIPMPIGFGLVIGGDLKREGLGLAEGGAAVQCLRR